LQLQNKGLANNTGIINPQDTRSLKAVIKLVVKNCQA